LLLKEAKGTINTSNKEIKLKHKLNIFKVERILDVTSRSLGRERRRKDSLYKDYSKLKKEEEEEEEDCEQRSPYISYSLAIIGIPLISQPLDIPTP